MPNDLLNTDNLLPPGYGGDTASDPLAEPAPAPRPRLTYNITPQGTTPHDSPAQEVVSDPLASDAAPAAPSAPRVSNTADFYVPPSPSGDPLIEAPVGPQLSDSRLGGYLQGQQGFASMDDVIAAIDTPDSDFDLDDHIRSIANVEAAQRAAQSGISPSSTQFARFQNNQADIIAAELTAEFRPMLAQRRQAIADAARAAEPDVQRVAEKEEQVGFFEQTFAFLGAGALQAGAGTLDLANFVLSSFGDADAEALDVEFLRDMSAGLRDGSTNLIEENTTEAFARQQRELDEIVNNGEGLGRRTVQLTGAMLDGDGLNFATAMLAQSVGYLAVSVAGGKGVGASARAAVRGTTALTPAATTAPRAVATAGQNIAAGRTMAILDRARPAAAVSVPISGNVIQESVDQIEEIAAQNPQALRATPGWQAAEASLQLELGYAPTDQQVLNRFTRRVAATAGATAATAAFVGTFIAPVSERAMTNLITQRTLGNVGVGSTTGRIARAAAVEALAEGGEEYVQTIAGDLALRTVGAGQNVGDALAATATPDAQLAGFLGAALGLTAGGGIAALSGADTLAQETSSEADSEGGRDDRSDATPSDDSGQTDRAQGDNATSDLSAEALPAQMRASFESNRAAAINALRADHGVTVSESASMGLGADHGVFTEGSPQLERGVYVPFFSEANRALGVSLSTGEIAYAVRTAEGEVVWSERPDGVQGMEDLINAVDAIQITASVDGPNLDVELAQLYARRRDAATSTDTAMNELIQENDTAQTEVDELGRVEQVSDPEPIDVLKEVSQPEAVMAAYEERNFGGLVSIEGDPRLDPASALTYVESTRVRLGKRAAFYESRLSNRRQLAETLTLRMVDLPSNVRESKGVRDFVAGIVQMPRDQQRAVAKAARFDPDQPRGVRAAAEQVHNMVEAAMQIDKVMYTKARTERVLTPKTAAAAVNQLSTLDPLAQQGDSRTTSDVFKTLPVGAFSNPQGEAAADSASAAQSQLEADLQAPAGSSTDAAISRSVDAVSTLPAPLVETAVGHPQPFSIVQNRSAGFALRNLITSRLAARGEYTNMLSSNANAVAQAASEFDVNTLQAIDRGMDTAMSAYAAQRMEQGVTNETLASEIVHAGGVTPSRAKQIIARARDVTPEDAPQVQAAALAQVDTLVRNAVSEETYDNPVEVGAIDDTVRRLNRNLSGRNIRIEWVEDLEAHRSAVFSRRLNDLENPTVAAQAALNAHIRAEFPVVGASAMYIKGADGRKDRVVLLRNRFPDAAAVERVLAHELVAHYGLRRLATEQGIADISEQILNSSDKTIRNMVNETRRKIVRARVAAREDEYRVNGATPPANLRQEIEREVAHDNFRATLGEEVLGTAVEAGYGTDLPRQSIGRRILELVRGIFSARSGLDVRNADDMAALIHKARVASGMLNDRLNPNYTPETSDLVGGRHVLNWFQKARDFMFDEEAAIHRVAEAASTLLDLPEQGAALSDGIVHAAGDARSRAFEVQGRFLAPMQRQLEEVRARLGMDHKEFYHSFNQLMYLRHSKERIRGLTYMHGKLSSPANTQRRAQIIADAERATTDQELAALSEELYQITDANLQKVDAESPDFGRHLVGRTFAEIDQDLAHYEDTGFAAAIDELNLQGPEGLLHQANEAILQNRRNSVYGQSGYARTRLLGWNFYVPMGNLDAREEAQSNFDDNAQLLRLNYDTLLPSAARLQAVEGTAAVPRMSVLMQLQHHNQRSAKDLVTNNVNRAFAEIALEERFEELDGGVTTTTLQRREGLEGILEDDIRAGVPYAEVGSALFNMQSKFGEERVQLTWRPDGTADIYAISDTRLANAFSSRLRQDFPEGTTGAATARVLQKATRNFGRLLTSYNPMFVMFRQFPRDLGQAMAQAGFEQQLGASAAFKVARDAFRYAPQMERFFLSNAETRANQLQEWRADPNHPMHSFARRAELGGVTFFEQQFNDPSEGPSFIEGDGALARVARGGRRAGEIIESLSNAGDNAVRQALYDQIVAVESAKPEGERIGTREEIEVYANNVATQTMNFSQRSSLGRFGSMLHPFFQTALTGTDAVLTRRIWRGGRVPTEQIRQPDGTIRTQFVEGWHKELNTPLMTTLGAMGIGSTLAAFAAVQAMDDDEVGPGAMLRPNSLMRNYFLPGFDRPIQVAVQPGLMGAVHATGAAIAMLAEGHHNTAQVGRAWRDSLIYNLTPLNSALGGEMSVDDFAANVIPTLMQPVLQHMTNRDAFGGPLASLDQNGDVRGVSTLYPRPSMPLVYERLAQEWADLGDAMGVDVDPSPELIRHYMRGWSGGIGQNLDRAFKMLQASHDGDPVSPLDGFLDFTGLQAQDPRFAHYNQYFTLMDETIAPIMAEYEQAVKHDRLAGAVSAEYRSTQPGGPAIMEVHARYNNAIRPIRTVTGRVQRNAGIMKRQLYTARQAGDVLQVQTIREDLERLYLDAALEIRAELDRAGIAY